MYAFEWLDNATTNETTKEIFRQFGPVSLPSSVTPTHLHD